MPSTEVVEGKSSRMGGIIHKAFPSQGQITILFKIPSLVMETKCVFKDAANF